MLVTTAGKASVPLMLFGASVAIVSGMVALLWNSKLRIAGHRRSTQRRRRTIPVRFQYPHDMHLHYVRYLFDPKLALTKSRACSSPNRRSPSKRIKTAHRDPDAILASVPFLFDRKQAKLNLKKTAQQPRRRRESMEAILPDLSGLFDSLAVSDKPMHRQTSSSSQAKPAAHLIQPSPSQKVQLSKARSARDEEIIRDIVSLFDNQSALQMAQNMRGDVYSNQSSSIIKSVISTVGEYMSGPNAKQQGSAQVAPAQVSKPRPARQPRPALA